AVDQDEIAVRPEPAEAQRGLSRRARCAGRELLAEERRADDAELRADVELRDGRRELRQLVHDAFDRDRARLLEALAVGRQDRAVRLDVASHASRAGNGHFLDRARLSECGAGDGRAAEDGRDRRSYGAKRRNVRAILWLFRVSLPLL